MSRFLVSALGATAVLCLMTAMAFAGQPDPGQSFGQERIGCSPVNLVVASQYSYTFTLVDNAGFPVSGFPASQVELRFTPCAEPSTRPLNEIPADGDSNSNGEVVWIAGLNFGGADHCSVEVLVQNQVFKTLLGGDPGKGPTPEGGLRSTDVNGDGLVALGDLSAWQVEFAQNNPPPSQAAPWIGDMSQSPNFDDLTALGDLSWWQQHFTAP